MLFQPARIGLAELYLQQSRWPELETLLTELEPHAALDAALLRARLHLARQEFAPARQLLETLLGQAPQLLPAYILLSHVLLQAGDEHTAEPLLRRIVEMDATQAESWRNLAVLYRRQQRLREALAASQAGRLHCPDDASLLLLHGILLHEAGDALNAETCLLRVLETDNGSGPAQQRRRTARQQLAALYRQLGRLQEASAHWRALLAEQPEDSAAALGLADCLLLQQRWPELEPLLVRLETDPNSAVAVLLLRAHVHLDDRFASSPPVPALMGQGVMSNQAGPGLAKDLRNGHLARQQGEQAERLLQEVLQRDASNAQAHQLLASLRRQPLSA